MKRPFVRLLGLAKRNLFGINRPTKDLLREVFKDPFNDISQFFTNHQVDTIFDVGANVGQTTIRFRQRYPEANIYSFEPYPSAFAQLEKKFSEDPRIHTHSLGLSSKIGSFDLYVSSADVLNSLFPPVDDSARGFSPEKTVKVLTTTVDSFCEEHNIDSIDILKIDVQGAEELTLIGSEKMLEKKAIALIITEIQFVSFYRGQSWYYDVFHYLAKRGYCLFDIYNAVYGKNGHIRWADAVFVNQKQALSSN